MESCASKAHRGVLEGRIQWLEETVGDTGDQYEPVGDTESFRDGDRASNRHFIQQGGGRYDGTFALTANPQNVTVTSSLSGRASRAVALK